MMSKIRMGLVGAAALGTAAFVIPAGGAQAQSAAPKTTSAVTASAGETGAQAVRCSGVRTIRINGGVLKYKECDNGPGRLVYGTLNDTKANGRCAWGKVRFVPSGVKRTYKDCGGAITKFNTGWHRASDAKVTLS